MNHNAQEQCKIQFCPMHPLKTVQSFQTYACSTHLSGLWKGFWAVRGGVQEGPLGQKMVPDYFIRACMPHRFRKDYFSEFDTSGWQANFKVWEEEYSFNILVQFSFM